MPKRLPRRPGAILLAVLAMAAGTLILSGCDRDNHSPGTSWSDKGTDSLSEPGLGAGAGAGWVGRAGVHPN
jgi:hypothetical protein